MHTGGQLISDRTIGSNKLVEQMDRTIESNNRIEQIGSNKQIDPNKRVEKKRIEQSDQTNGSNNWIERTNRTIGSNKLVEQMDRTMGVASMRQVRQMPRLVLVKNDFCKCVELYFD